VTTRLLILCCLIFGVSSFAAVTSSGADREEGWIVRRTSRGLVKVPKKQSFRFQGSDIFGLPSRPAETTFGQRQGRQNRSLIPVRQSFDKEFLGSMGQNPRANTNKKD
jgi:hypothetical protein